MDLRPHIEKFRRRYAEVEAALSDPKAFDNPQRAQELSREYARLKELVAQGENFLKTAAQLGENRALLKSEPPESEMALMAKEEIARLEAAEKRLAQQIQFGLVPPDPTDSRNTIIEIRAGAGGNESALFSADLYRMYCRYAEARGWKIETMDSNPSDLGGFKEIIFSVIGTDVFKRLKYESGVHRVQRVPATEAQGRIHTSTATVAVLPEAQEVDVEIKPDEIEDQRLPRVRQGRAGREHHRFRRANPAQTERPHRPHRRRALADKKPGEGDDCFALASARKKNRRGKREIRRAAQRPGRHRRTQRKNPHLQFPAEPRHRPPHRSHALQSGDFIDGDLDPLIEPLMTHDLEERLKALNS